MSDNLLPLAQRKAPVSSGSPVGGAPCPPGSCSVPSPDRGSAPGDLLSGRPTPAQTLPPAPCNNGKQQQFVCNEITTYKGL